MLSSISLGSIDNLEKLPINSLNSICDRVRQALLHVFLPRLCEKCKPAFAETFKKTQSTPLLLKVLCDPCKLSYVKDKRSVSRRKPKPEKTVVISDEISQRKYPAKKRPSEHSRTEDSDFLENTMNTAISNSFSSSNGSFKNLTLKIRLISTPKSSESFDYRLPLTPPPIEQESKPLINSNSFEFNQDVTIFIDNSIEKEVHVGPIYENFTEKGIDWCRYCGVAGDTGTFWKLGPWGDRTLCHKHGCEFFGCGFARVTRTRLDLTEFYGEKKTERKRPIVSEFCSICWNRFTNEDSEILTCNGCPLSFHKSCRNEPGLGSFYCTENCKDNWKNSLIRPQFSSKSSFPFYRQILLLPSEDDVPTEHYHQETSNQIDKVVVPKLKLNLKTLIKKRKQYRKNRIENHVDRVIAFLPIKVDQSVHVHENIKTPQWSRKSLQERQSYEISNFNDQESELEDLNDDILLNRHSRYEHVEKTTRLLKPGVLNQLISDAS